MGNAGDLLSRAWLLHRAPEESLDRKLNKAELYALAVAQERINDALGTLRMVEASRDELILAVGLTPGVAYQIADDGTVTAEISGQGSEGLDGNGTV